MSSLVVHTAVQKLIDAHWTGNLAPENIQSEPPENLDSVLVVSYMDEDEEQTMIAGDHPCMEESGDVVLKYFVESGTGLDTHMAKLEALGNAFRGAEIDGVRFSEVEPVDSFPSSGNLTEIEIIIHYNYNFQAA